MMDAALSRGHSVLGVEGVDQALQVFRERHSDRTWQNVDQKEEKSIDGSPVSIWTTQDGKIRLEKRDFFTLSIPDDQRVQIVCDRAAMVAVAVPFFLCLWSPTGNEISQASDKST
jgi:hypothetical protein